jgi:hypothetical protein
VNKPLIALENEERRRVSKSRPMCDLGEEPDD